MPLDESVHILLVEDDEVDAEAIVRAFHKQNLKHPITIVSDGFEALRVLRGEDGATQVSSPYLILALNGMQGSVQGIRIGKKAFSGYPTSRPRQSGGDTEHDKDTRNRR